MEERPSGKSLGFAEDRRQRKDRGGEGWGKTVWENNVWKRPEKKRLTTLLLLKTTLVASRPQDIQVKHGVEKNI